MPRAHRRDLGDLVDKVKGSRGPHLPPGRAHLRSAAEKYRAKVPPDATFPRKLAAFLQTQVVAWVVNYLKFRFGRKHAFQTYDGTGESGIYPLAGDSYFHSVAASDEEIRISVAGDWATGTEESEQVARRMQEFHPHYTIHIGDVYFVGDRDEVEANCLGREPHGSEIHAVRFPAGSVGSFAMNGNHEMYANGDGYFDLFLPTLGMRPANGVHPAGGPHAAMVRSAGQKASYFCLRNDYWDIIGLDTGYNSVGLPILEKLPWFQPSCKLPDELMKWLGDEVKPRSGGRGIVLLSHHQNYSAFEDRFETPARQLAEFIDRPVLWLWGHEHRLAIYGKARTDGGIESFGRCLGHGGMPVDIGFPIKYPEYPVVLYDDRAYQTIDDVRVGFNGLAQLTIRGKTLQIEYRDIGNNLLLREDWETVDGILRGRNVERGISHHDIPQPRDLPVAIGGAAAATR